MFNKDSYPEDIKMPYKSIRKDNLIEKWAKN